MIIGTSPSLGTLSYSGAAVILPQSMSRNQHQLPQFQQPNGGMVTYDSSGGMTVALPPTPSLGTVSLPTWWPWAAAVAAIGAVSTLLYKTTRAK